MGVFDKENHKSPLLLAVRSGSEISMAGVMDTILNVGINDKIFSQLLTVNAKFATTCYGQFIKMLAISAMGANKDIFKEINQQTIDYNSQKECEQYIQQLKLLVEKDTRSYIPQDPQEQLTLAIHGIFNSARNKNVTNYKQIYHISQIINTAVTVQTMVFGNLDDNSGTGVFFSRNINTAENHIYGEFLPIAQGEDLVGGHKTPFDLSYLKENLPAIYQELEKLSKNLEIAFQAVVDVEFTIESGVLWILQCRKALMGTTAQFKTSLNLLQEKILTKEQFILQTDSQNIENIFVNEVDYIKTSNIQMIVKGTPLSTGAVCGKVVFSTKDIPQSNNNNKQNISKNNREKFILYYQYN